MLEVHVPSQRFDHGPVILEDCHFQLPTGSFTCLIGPSGCGKTTLLKLIGGLDQCPGSLIDLDGNPPKDIGIMFQTPRLMPWLSVLDNVLLVLPDTQEAATRSRKLLAAMDLGNHLHSYPNRLSGGMQRRVALARAFAITPQLLLLDEPFISLDRPVAGRLRAMLLNLWQVHRPTVLFVTHDLGEALSLADLVLFLSTQPARVVLEQPVDLPRPRQPDDPAILALQQRLLADHPALLAGIATEQIE